MTSIGLLNLGVMSSDREYPNSVSESLYACASGVFELLQVGIIPGKASYMTGSDLM